MFWQMQHRKVKMGVQNKLTSEEKDLFIPTEKPEKVTKKIKTNKTSDP